MTRWGRWTLTKNLTRIQEYLRSVVLVTSCINIEDIQEIKELGISNDILRKGLQNFQNTLEACIEKIASIHIEPAFSKDNQNYYETKGIKEILQTLHKPLMESGMYELFVSNCAVISLTSHPSNNEAQ